MRYGFTTGSCAAAGSKAAAYMLLTGKIRESITIQTPKGIDYTASIKIISRLEDSVSCGVVKDGGDDPDITTGALIVSTVSFLPDPQASVDSPVQDSSCDSSALIKEPKEASIIIQGGVGVGKVTKPGLDQPVGNAAINHVPREMIVREVEEVCRLCDYRGSLLVEISVPDGEALAMKTFNPRLGIEGGISILGTTGIVEPMSSQALLDTIKVELNQKKALGYTVAAVSPGNYGLDFMKDTFSYDLDGSVKCSNFIGDTIDMAAETGFRKLLLTGHIGKLVKVSGGIMNTHSKEGDCRMELLAAAAIKNGCSLQCATNILDAVVTEDGLSYIQAEGRLPETMAYLMEKIMFFLEKRAAGRMEIACMMYSNSYGLLAESSNARVFLAEAMRCR